MRIECQEVWQNGRPMYVATMKVADLKDPEHVLADTWARNNPDGYQRDPTISRVKAFARFISKGKGISPLSVLLSIRSRPTFTKLSGNLGVLEVPDDAI